jgi:hypothetical protein
MFDVTPQKRPFCREQKWPFQGEPSTLSAAGVLLVEALDPAFGVDKFRVTGVEGMAVAAGVHVHLGFGGPGFGHRAAGTMNFCVHVFGVKISFHVVLQKLVEGGVL